MRFRTRLPGSQHPWMTVNAPLLPSMAELTPLIEEVLESAWVTNQGEKAQTLERTLADFLQVPEALLVTNATIGLHLALRSLLPEGGEVIVPGYSFPATWAMLLDDPRYRARFVDIGPDCCLDVAAVEAAIGPQTTAILGVHAYGLPCQHAALQALAQQRGLAVFYDAAHAFGVLQGGQSLASWGDLSVFSFHATKVFNTLEGGAITGKSDILKTVKLRRNFGIVAEDIFLHGSNGKVDEFRAAVGLINLRHFEEALLRRRQVIEFYVDFFEQRAYPHVRTLASFIRQPDLSWNYGYFPVFIKKHGNISRDSVQDVLHSKNILTRKYFYPTIPNSPLYQGLYTPGSLPNTLAASLEVLCLPVHHRLVDEDLAEVVAAFELAMVPSAP